MKISSLLFGLTVGLTIMVVLPFAFISLNSALGLPVYSGSILKVLGLLCLLAGGILFVYCTQLFKLIGKGTPVPIEPPKELVVKGLYKYTRNPIYLGYWFIILGEFLLFGQLLLLAYLLLFIFANHLYVIYLEEKDLYKRFGTPYRKYVNEVPRYLPRIFGLL